MRFVFPVLVLLASLTPGRADQPTAANTLTPSEIADSWILLFDGKTTFGWTVEGDVKIEDGTFVLGGKNPGKIITTCEFGEGSFSVEMDGKIQTHQTENTEGKTAKITIGSIADHVTRLRNIKLKPAGMTSLFNGKDLTGWHPYVAADAKSKFSVTPEGTLHIENGKGDLQTDKKWADFLLQIECKTNAKALNSGVFFRCQPDKYQQGYEAQIQNSFMASPSKEYTIDRYDPKTNALLGKDKVKYDSFDYGTGGIYRRIPARFQACKDMEWFTMTILAQGRHMGVWVNGLMVTDWTDNRPINDNARNGCRLEAGNISLQGHDPTTNLDFRNIRIAEFGKP